MNELLNSLILWAATLTGYEAPKQLPLLEPVDVGSLSSTLCQGEYCTALAYYDASTKTIYYDKRLDFDEEYGAISFLLHELVHYVQHMNGVLNADMTDCKTRIDLEKEAYRVQRYFLIEHHLNTYQTDLAIALLDNVCSEAEPKQK